MPTELDDLAFRESVFAWLRERLSTTEVFTRSDLAQFEFLGRRHRLVGTQTGIWRVKDVSDAAISILTSYVPDGHDRPYDDEVGDDGLLRYEYRGTDPNFPDNVWLRTAMERHLPLVWFTGVGHVPGTHTQVFRPEFPVWLVAEELEQHQFAVAVDEGQQPIQAGAAQEVMEITRRHNARIVQTRHRQPIFRTAVLHASEQRCAVCRLPFRELLDAAHIREDSRGGAAPPSSARRCTRASSARPAGSPSPASASETRFTARLDRSSPASGLTPSPPTNRLEAVVTAIGRPPARTGSSGRLGERSSATSTRPRCGATEIVGTESWASFSPLTVSGRQRMKLMPLRYAGNCTTCGRRVEQGAQAWYDPATKVTCTSCRPVGAQLTVVTAAPEPAPAPDMATPRRSVRTDLEKGTELEQRIAEVFRAAGYSILTNVKREGRSGSTHEVDVLAEKRDELLTLSVAIECKAWNSPIEKDVVAKFNEVRRDLGLGHAVIVSLNGARPGATTLADELGVVIWGPDEISRHVGNSSVLDLQNRPMVEEVGFPRLLDRAGAGQLVAKDTGGRLGVGKEEIVWSGDAWIPVAVVQLTLRKYGLRQAVTGKAATSQAWAVYDLIGGTFVTRLDDEPERTPVTIDGQKLHQLLKLAEPAKSLGTLIDKWQKVTSEAATQKYRSEMDRLGIPEMHTATVGDSHPFLYPVHLAIAQRNGTERVVAIDCFRNRLDPDLGGELSKQIAPVRSALGA